MSARLGNPIEQVTAAAATGGASGRSIALNPAAGLNQWCMVISLLITYVASGGGGNRNVVAEIKDASGNILWAGCQGTAITAGQTVLIGFGAGVAAGALTGPPIQQFMPLPDGFCAPPGATVNIFDGNNASVTDTVAMNAVLST